MPIITVNSALTLSATDGASSILNKVVLVASSCTLLDYSSSLNVSTSPLSLLLPISPIQVAYIKNIGATNNLQVTWTPNGGSTAVIQKLTPGSYIFFIQTAVGQGVTAISVQAITSDTQIEYVLAG